MGHSTIAKYFSAHTSCMLVLHYVNDHPQSTLQNVFEWFTSINAFSGTQKDKNLVRAKLRRLSEEGLFNPRTYIYTDPQTQRELNIPMRTYTISTIGREKSAMHPEWREFYQNVLNGAINKNQIWW